MSELVCNKIRHLCYAGTSAGQATVHPCSDEAIGIWADHQPDTDGQSEKQISPRVKVIIHITCAGLSSAAGAFFVVVHPPHSIWCYSIGKGSVQLLVTQQGSLQPNTHATAGTGQQQPQPALHDSP